MSQVIVREACGLWACGILGGCMGACLGCALASSTWLVTGIWTTSIFSETSAAVVE